MGSTGAYSFSIGQAFYTVDEGASGSVSKGIQQPFDSIVISDTSGCTNYVLELYDHYGDGWVFPYIDVYVNGELVIPGAQISCFCFLDTVLIPVNNGDIISLDYVSEGIGFPEETGYSLYDGSGNLIVAEGIDFTVIPGDFGNPNSDPPTGAKVICEILNSSIIEYNTNILVYPNPTKDILNLELQGEISNNLRFELIDFTGRIIEQGEIINQNKQLSISDLPPSIYFIKVSANGEAIKTIKVIKNN